MKNFFWTVFVLTACFFCSAQGNCTQTWVKSYGAFGDEMAQDIQLTRDGGYIVGGYTRSFGAGNTDIWLLKLDSSGSVEWEKTYGGIGADEIVTGHSIQQTADGGYILVGITTDSAGAGAYDMVVLRLDDAGDIIWQKTFGGSGMEWGWVVKQVPQGGFIVAGSVTSFGAGSADVWLLKLDDNGNIEWEKAYGNYDTNMAFGLTVTQDGGCALTAYYRTSTSSFDAWVLKLDAAGNILWQKRHGYGGTGERQGDFLNTISQTSDGGYILAGNTMSWAAGPYDTGPDASVNMWVLRLDSGGNYVWGRVFGDDGLEPDGGSSAQQTPDGGFIVSGMTRSFGNGQLSTPTEYDTWVLKLNASGDILWEKTYGGPDEDGTCRKGTALRQTPDGGYVVAGSTYSFSVGSGDAWVLKLNSTGGLSGQDCAGIINNSAATVTVTTDHRVDDTSVTTTNTQAVVGNPGWTAVDSSAIVNDTCETTLIRLVSFEARAADRAVVLRWTTGAEINNAGFNLLRSEAADGHYVKINAQLIPAEGSPAGGASYEFIDAGVENRRIYYYRLEDLDLGGQRTRHEPADATPRHIYRYGKRGCGK